MGVSDWSSDVGSSDLKLEVHGYPIPPCGGGRGWGVATRSMPAWIAAYETKEWSLARLAGDAMAMERPVLPAPHQVVAELDRSILGYSITSKRSLVYHAWVTLSSTLLGFVMGTVLGIQIGRAHV